MKVFILFIGLIIISHVECNANFSYPDTIMTHIFNKYKSNERPSEINQTIVTVYMTLLAINSIDVIRMEYSTDVYLRQEWTDKRLAWNGIEKLNEFNNSIVSPALKDKMWLPDLFFRNGKKGYVHSMTTPNYLLRINSNGEVLYSQKITMRFSCQMELQTFPMDTQECNMDIGSYGYTLDQLKFRWRSHEPMKLPKKMEIPEFNHPKDIETIDCSKHSSTGAGDFTCIKVTFYLQRQLGSYLASTYIPNVLIVMVSWLNFWVSIEAVPARITLGLLTLLGMLTQATGMSTNLPRVSYIKAIDVWIIACIIFVIGALIEFAVASMISRKNKSDLWKRDVEEIVRQELQQWPNWNRNLTTSGQLNLPLIDEDCNGLNNEHTRRQLQHLLTKQLMRTSTNSTTKSDENNTSNKTNNQFHEKTSISSTISSTTVIHKSKMIVKEPPILMESEIDSYSQFLFPAFFMLYNCFYWLYYLIQVHKRNVEMGLA